MSSGTTPGHTEDPPDEATGASVGDSGTGGDGEASPEPPVEDGGTAGVQTSPGRRAWPGVVARAVVVLVVAGIGYQLVIPTTSTVRSRLARLVVTTNGTKTFPGRASHAAEEAATTGALAPLEAAAKAHPDQTGLYVAQWAKNGSTGDGLAIVTFLLPDVATATKARTQLAASQLSAGALSSSGFTRSAQFTPPGVANAAGSVFSPGKGGSPAGQAALVVAQQGRVVALVEAALTTGSPQADATTATQAEAAHLRSVEPGFTLSVTRNPTTATVVWAAASVVVLLIVTGGPLLWRRRKEREERRLQEELARTIRVGGSTIVRKRHGE